MKKPVLIAVALFALIGLIFSFAPRVAAQSALTDQQRDRIRANCVSIKNSLNQLKASDALLRVNRGQAYESLSSKLMDNFNARLASKSFDTQGLLSVTSSYDTALDTFRVDYQAYERQLASLIRIDCSKDPDGFHLALENARTKRATLHNSVKRLHNFIDDYRSAVGDFKLNFERVAEDE